MTTAFAVAAALGVLVLLVLAVDSWLCRAKTREILHEAHETLERAHALLGDAEAAKRVALTEARDVLAKIRHKPAKGTR